MTEQYRVGDRVELVVALPFRRPLRAGLRGAVVAVVPEFGWLTVVFEGHARPYQVRPQSAPGRRGAGER